MGLSVQRKVSELSKVAFLTECKTDRLCFSYTICYFCILVQNTQSARSDIEQLKEKIRRQISLIEEQAIREQNEIEFASLPSNM
jgi:hypothetical protein